MPSRLEWGRSSLYSRRRTSINVWALARFTNQRSFRHSSRSRPYHPQTQGKIERWHRSLKNQILLENYYLPGELENQIQAFIEYYNHERYHESIYNLTPADVFYGRGQQILDRRQQIKLNTSAMRKQMHYHNRMQNLNQMS